MALTLKVLSYKNDPPREMSSASFDQQGGSLGRSSENHFVLADPERFVSRKHAVISYENGFYYLTDTSTEGTFVTNKNQHVRGNKIQLADGDTLRMGDYDLSVSISGSDSVDPAPISVATHADDPSIFQLLDGPSAGGEDIVGGDKASGGPDSGPFDIGVADPSPPPIDIREHIGGSLLDASLAPPEIASPEPAQPIPEDFDFIGLVGGGGETEKPSDDAGKPAEIPPDPVIPELDTSNGQNSGAGPGSPPPQSPKPSPTPLPDGQLEVTEAPRESSAEGYGDVLNEFFKAAGIEDASFLPAEQYAELMRTVGAVFKELIDGLMIVLRARSELKSQFRVSMTVLQSVENNPLKFSPTVGEALKLLLTPNQPGFIDAVDAVREGYQDVMNHQLAITAGVQASLMSLVSRFDPQKFARKYEEGIVLQKKAKCWDAYRQAYREIAREALENFFGEEFARAYEEQMSKLRTTLKKG